MGGCLPRSITQVNMSGSVTSTKPHRRTRSSMLIDRIRCAVATPAERAKLAVVVIVAVLTVAVLGLWGPKRPCRSAPSDWLEQLPNKEQKIFSQNGEDGILATIFKHIGTTKRFYVEFGAETGAECNTRLLRERFRWRGLLMDGGNENAAIGLRKEFVTTENVNDLFQKYGVPREFDLLSIDVNFDDWHIWRALDNQRYWPRVVVIEYNAAIPVDERRVIDPEDTLRWPTAAGTTNYWGASLRALRDLGRLKGYDLVACDSTGVNAFFLRSDILACQGVQPPPLEEAYVHNPFPHYLHETNASRVWLLLDEQCEVVQRVPSPQIMLHNIELQPFPKPLRR